VATGAGRPEEHTDPVLQLLVNLTREGTVIAAFQSTHEKFRRYHADLLRLAAVAASDERARNELLRTLDAYAELFHEHHHAEDNYLFPALRKAEPAMDTVVDRLADQHQQLGTRLGDLLSQARRIRAADARDDRVALLVDPLMELRANVEEHLQLEETATVPVVRAWSSWPI
jgi:branched-chain amino acid transport system ATP-binding protein